MHRMLLRHPRLPGSVAPVPAVRPVAEEEEEEAAAVPAVAPPYFSIDRIFPEPALGGSLQPDHSLAGNAELATR